MACSTRRHNAALHRSGRFAGAAEGDWPRLERRAVRATLMALICDTGPLYAAMDRRDLDHEQCAELLAGGEEQLVVPAPVLVELEWLATKRLGAEAFDTFLADVEDRIVRVEPLLDEDYARIRGLCRRYDDLALGFVDAAVLAVVERLGERKLATLDERHFRTVRPKHARALKLLPADAG
jgi:predicted nucleic acid-binding protein